MGLFCLPQFQSKENTAFHLILRSTRGFRVPESKLVLYVGKEAKFWLEKVNVAKLHAIESPVLKMEKILKNKLSPLKVN